MAQTWSKIWRIQTVIGANNSPIRTMEISLSASPKVAIFFATATLPLVGRRKVDADDDARFRHTDATHRRRQVAERRINVGETETSSKNEVDIDERSKYDVIEITRTSPIKLFMVVTLCQHPCPPSPLPQILLKSDRSNVGDEMAS